MKKSLVAAAYFLLVISLIGVGFSFSQPADVSVTKSVKVLDYTQNGIFDYAVTMKPSYFYNGVPLATPEPNPQIPLKFILSFSLTYDFRASDGSTKDMEINAILESPGSRKERVPAPL
jgi:pyruvate/2-oxoglutarate dehydrogenase complex dihydrolipoamide acyltransferase (E2) component